MSFTEKTFSPGNVQGLAAVNHIYEQCPNAFLVLTRLKNGNVVVYEGQKEEKTGRIVSVDNYWLDLEPSYKKSKGNDRKNDRDSLNIIERNAYGCTLKPRSTSVSIVRMKKIPSVVMAVISTKKGCEARMKMHGKTCKIHHVYVHDTSVLGIPSADYFEIVGHDVETGKEMTKRYTK
jgi:Domain of unknown function (DUF4833)